MRGPIPVAAAALLVAALSPAAEWSVDFSQGTDGWLVPRPSEWATPTEGENRFLRLVEPGPIGEPRRPVKFAVFEEACVGDFDASVRVRRKEKSLIVVFGYQDRAHFYYAHLSSDDGDHSVHNGIFKVQGGSRYRIAGLGSAPALPEPEWTSIRIQRTVADGKIEVWAGDDPEPRFSVVDPSFRFGRLGLGSFDETGDFDDFKLTGEPSDACPSQDLSPLDPS